MAIKNYTTGDVPFLVNYEPYSTDGNISCDFVEEMISFDLRSLVVPTKINYFVGAETGYVTTLKIKNITLNATLNITVQFNKNVFIINKERGRFEDASTVSSDLLPQQTVEYYIEIRKETLDSQTEYIDFLSNILLTIKNYSNGSTVIKNPSEQLLGEKFLPQEITVK